MLRIVVNGNIAKIHGNISDDTLNSIDSMTKFRRDGYQFTNRYRSGDWDGWTHLYKSYSRSFPIGFLERVEMLLLLEKIEYAIEDKRTIHQSKSLSSNIELRDYQKAIVEDAIQKKNCLIPACVGSGKTEMAIVITTKLGLSTLFVTPTKDILYQTQERFRDALGIDIGIIGEGKFEPNLITIATWQSISSGIKKKNHKIFKYLSEINVIIWDEVHHLSADKLFDVAMHCPAKYRYGLSGTMFRTDNSELKFFGAIGELGSGITASELIDMNYLVHPIIKFIRTIPITFRRRDGWKTVYKVGVVDNEERNQMLADETKKLMDEGRITLVLVSEIRHGQRLQSMIPNSIFICSNAKDRPEIIEQFRKGEIPCIVSTPIWDEGVDIPIVRGIVLAGAGKSQIKAVQRVGRGLRTYKGKDNVKIIDCNDPMLYLWDHSKERYKMYAQESKFIIEGDVPSA